MYTRCFRCGKPLKDYESKERGFGPSCFKKVQEEGNDYKPVLIKISVIDIAKATDVQYKLRTIIETLDSKCRCGEAISNGVLKSYDHPNGLPAAGYKYPQWFYVHCESCGYDTAITKLNVNTDDLREY